ncbi:MAG: gamma-glutamyltransferase [Pseudomonadota bacterium]
MRLLLTFVGCLAATACAATDPIPAAEAPTSRQIIRYDTIHHPVVSQRGMVVSQNDVASRIGADILAQGGNAVDASIATGLALAVTLPRAGNIGGSGFMLVHMADTDETVAIDYYSAAPVAADREAFRNDDGKMDRSNRYGYIGVAIPGTVAGFHKALQDYGTMSWREVAQPAIDLARDGIVVTRDLHYALAAKRHVLVRDPGSRAVYFKPDGSLYAPGETLRFPDLADTLEAIADGGADAFYRGEIANRIDDAMRQSGGFVRQTDLADYIVYAEEPLRCTYRDYEVALMVPPSSGVYVCQLLNILEQHDIRELGAGSGAYFHVLAEALKLVFADRSAFTGGKPQYAMPVDRLTDKDYARRLAETIDLSAARSFNEIRPGALAPPAESRDTTHYSVVDRFGNAVSNTYTLGSSFGSGVTVPGTGVLFNDHIGNFALSVGEPGARGFQANPNNQLGPGKRAVSTISPMLVFKNDELVFVSGSPGGTRIISAVAQVLVSIVDFEMNVAEATMMPRIHQQWSADEPDELQLERGHSMDTVRLLEQLGHRVGFSPTFGSVQSIFVDGNTSYGAADPRRPGALAVVPD